MYLPEIYNKQKDKITVIKLSVRAIAFLIVLTLFSANPAKIFTKYNLSNLAEASSLGISVSMDSGVDGDIVIFKSGNYSLSSTPFDDGIYGVVNQSPVIGIKDRSITNSRLVVTYGATLVNVSSANGAIKKGEYVTTSSKAGVGQKADKTGQVLGIALEDYDNSSKDAVGQISVFVDIKTAFITNNYRGNLLSALKIGSFAPFLTPLASLRYILAAIVTAASFIIGFSSFAKISGNSLQALGRNPLAKKDINATVIFNFLLIFAVMGVGLGLSYLILIL